MSEEAQTPTNEAPEAPEASNSLLNTEVTPEATTTPVDAPVDRQAMIDFVATLDEDLRGEKTWDKFNNPQDLAKSYKELQALVGRKSDIPEESAPPEVWDEFYNKMGRPEDANDYGITLPPELADIPQLEGRIEKLSASAHKAGISKAQLKTFMESEFANEIESYKGMQEAQQANIEAQSNKLKEAWGESYATMASEVQTLQKKLGIYEDFEAEGLNGNASVLIALSKIAQQTKSSSTIDEVTASTPQGIGNAISELQTKAGEYLAKNEKVPDHITNQLNELYARG